MKTIFLSFFLFSSVGFCQEPLKIGDPAPQFQIKDFQGQDFKMASRRGKWTVLYFYPKAGTPGCTKEACGFRDGIKKIEVLGASVFGISTDSVQEQAKFHEDQHLNFTLLADPDGKVVNQYGSRMGAMNMANRWTFIIDPTLTIREIEKDVDPVLDAKKVADKIAELQKNPADTEPSITPSKKKSASQ